MKSKYLVFSFLLLNLISLKLFAQITEKQQHLLDSLIQIIEENKHDTLVAEAYLNSGEVLYLSHTDTLEYFCKIAKKIAEKNLANPSISTAERKSFYRTLASSLNNLGYIYTNQGNILKGLEYYQKSLKIKEKIGNKNGIAYSFNNLAYIYYNQGEYKKALDYTHKSLKIREEIKDNYGIGSSLQNLGAMYTKSGDTIKGIKYFKKSLEIREKIEDKEGIANSLSSLGVIYDKQGDTQKALKCLHKSLTINEEIKYKYGQVSALNALAGVSLSRGMVDRARVYGERSMKIAQEIGYPLSIKDAADVLSKVYKKQKKFKKGWEYYQLYILMNDSIRNTETEKATITQELNYEYEKKEAVISAEHKKEMEKQELLAEAKSRRQKIIIYSVIGGLFLVIVFALFIYRSLNITKKQKNIISLQKEVVEGKNQELGVKNKQIADSIDYAKNIQQAILPSEEEIETLLPDSFIFYQPKDVVSGDFYWMQELEITKKSNDQIVLFAAIDCTGHGVPGAFVSLMAFNFLEKIVNEHNTHSPSKILQELNREVIQVLRKDGQMTSTKYGMDMSLVSWNKSTNKIIYAGARNPLYVIADNKLTQIEADRMSIGTTPAYEFTEQEVDTKRGDMLYLFTDGYADQKGGAEEKKFYYPPFRELLAKLSSKSAKEQENVLEETFIKWKGNIKQIDDVLIIGAKI